MPIYFLLSIWVLLSVLSVGPEPKPQAYFERGALFYNALTAMPTTTLMMVVSLASRWLVETRWSLEEETPATPNENWQFRR
jgi:hypothetical protein